MKRLFCLIILFVFWSGLSVFAQMPRAESEIRSDPKNIREIFLTVPWPKSERDSVSGRIEEKIGGFADRQRWIDQVVPGKDNSIVDLANGYLRIELGEGLYVVMTYFQKSNNDRLVV